MEVDAKAAKIRRVEDAVAAFNTLHGIAKSRVTGELSDDEVERKTVKLVNDVNDTETLMRFAVFANRASYPGSADCAKYDDILDFAFWEVVERVKHSRSPDPVESLERLGHWVGAQGGYAIRLNEAIEFAQARIKAEQVGQPERR